MNKFEFHVGANFHSTLDNSFILFPSNWDDYGARTTFILEYIKDGYKIEIGEIKILNPNNEITLEVIPKYFKSLDLDKFCSLGQNIHFYRKLQDKFPNEYQIILKLLNDVAFYPSIADNFNFISHFGFSLLRTSEAEKAFYEARKIILKENIESNFNFIYKTNVKNASSDHIINFDFNEYKHLPNRINAVIGKNGTGKTQVLANLALDLSGNTKDKYAKKKSFDPRRPLFSKIIAISYSTFDDFDKPRVNHSFSYKYCGLKDLDGNQLSDKEISENFGKAINVINQFQKGMSWALLLKQLFGEEKMRYLHDHIILDGNFDIIKDLSSGQSFLIYVLTELVSAIKPNSLLIFDEPEMHLHPNAISRLIGGLQHLLEKYDSYAIIATHSPIVLQEIPSRFVKVFDREGNTPLVYKLGIESFGETIENLTKDIFQLKDSEQNFKIFFRMLSAKYSYKEILSFFDDKLNPHAKSYLLSCYKNPEKQLGDG